MNYIDVVLCQHENNNRPFLFQAPFCSGLKEGDTVIVNTAVGQSSAVVKAVGHIATEDDNYRLMVLSAGAKHPLKKVVKRVVFEEIIYDEGVEA